MGDLRYSYSRVDHHHGGVRHEAEPPPANVERDMLTEEIRGHVASVLALDGISIGRTIDLIRSRANGTGQDQLLTAVVTLLREQASQIAVLETEVAELTSARDRLEDEVTDLEAELEALRARPNTRSPAGAA
jgi:hypothetical protein